MLRRIRRLAVHHHKTIILCTHILPDVQTVSDAAIILATGQVRVADTLENLSAPTRPSVDVRVMGSPEDFLRAIKSHGLDAELDGMGTITVCGGGHAIVQQVWHIARETGTMIRGLTPAHNSLEAIFLAAVKGQTRGTS